MWKQNQEKKFGFILFLAVLSGVAPFAMSLVVPSLPRLAEEFHLNYDELQYMVSVFLIGIALSQPIHGFLCDRFGRRPVLLGSFLIFTLASFTSVYVENWTLLVVCRFIQAAGVSVGTVTSRAIVHDVSSRRGAAQLLSYLGVSMGISPMIAPLIGGYLDVEFGWRFGFALSGWTGLAVLVFAWFRLAETRPESAQSGRGSFGHIMGRYLLLLKSPVFMGYTLVFGFCQGTFFAFLPVAPQIFASNYMVSTEGFTLYWSLLSSAYVLGAYLSGRLVKIFDLDSTLLFSCLGIFLSIIILMLLSLVFPVTFLMLMTAMIFGITFSGMACPLALTGSISHVPSMTGAASGLSSSLGMGVGALFSLLTGVYFDGSIQPMIFLMSISVTGALGAVILSRLGRQPDEDKWEAPAT